MKKRSEKKSNFLGVMVVLLSIIVIGLASYIFYDKVLSKDINKENNSTNNDVTLSKDAARKIVEEKTKLVFNYEYSLMPYCGERDEKDYIETENFHRWDASTSYFSKEELLNYLRTFMSDDVINEYSSEDRYTVSEPIYKEENNKLYCYHPYTGGGYQYNEGKTHYQILNITKNSIDAIGYIFFTDYGEMSSNITTIKLEKNEKNDWIMTSYASLEDGVQDLTLAELYLDDVIFINKTNPEHKITVYYDEKEIIDSQEIEKLKGEIHLKYGYEGGDKFNIFIDYDEVGYIKKILLYPLSKPASN